MVFDSSDDVAYDDADNVFILDVQVGVGPAGFSAIAPWLSTEIQLPHMNTHPVVMIIILVELMIWWMFISSLDSYYRLLNSSNFLLSIFDCFGLLINY